MDQQAERALRNLPWITLILSIVIWTIHLSVRIFGQPEVIRDTYGLEFEDLYSYLTYSLLHADMIHIIGNSFLLLLCGTFSELQQGRFWFSATIIISIIAGAISAVLFHMATGTIVEHRIIGISSATSAMTVISISVIARYWRRKSTWLISDKLFHLLFLPIGSVASLLILDLYGTWAWNYSIGGHFSGSMIGAIMIYATVQSRVATSKTRNLIQMTKIIAYRTKKVLCALNSKMFQNKIFYRIVLPVAIMLLFVLAYLNR